MPGSSGTGVHAPSGARSASARPCAAAVPPSAPTTTSSRSDRMGTEATARDVMRQLDAASAGYTNYADRKSTRLNSSHGYISYAVFCLKKKKKRHEPTCEHETR